MEKQRSREEGIEIGKSQGIEIGKNQGIEIGLQEGKQEGRQETQKSIAAKMKASGMEMKQIAEMTELSIEEIEKL